MEYIFNIGCNHRYIVHKQLVEKQKIKDRDYPLTVSSGHQVSVKHRLILNHRLLSLIKREN